MALNDTHNALINFNKSTAINDQQSDVFYARGMLHFTLGRHDAAVHDHRRAVQLGGVHSIPSSIYKTFNHTHHYGNNTILRNIYQNKLNAEKNALNECKGDESYKIEHHRLIAEYYQQLAPYTHDPQATHQDARPHIEATLKLSTKPNSQNTVTDAIHQLREAQILCEKYPGGIASKRIVEQFISSTIGGIMQMNEALKQCSTAQGWKDLVDVFSDLLIKSRSDSGPYNIFNSFRYETIQVQLKKVQMMKETIEKFSKSPEQQEFYKLIIIRLCNIFDATRAATTGIFQHALTGALGNVSWGFMILGKVFQWVPEVGDTIAQVLGFVEQGLKKIDEKRIQNALTHIGCFETAQKLNETANEIAEKLTIMYEKQIQQFPTSDEKPGNKNQDESKESSGCAACCKNCIECLTRTKNKIMNKREDTIMQTIAKYAISLILGRLIVIDINKINTITDLRNSFLNAVCNVPYERKFFRMIIATKITKSVKTNIVDDDWDTHMFFRGPVVQLPNGARLTSKHMNSEKFGYRGPSWDEENWYENNRKKLEELGFTKEEIKREI